jgi:hypothetical protein
MTHEVAPAVFVIHEVAAVREAIQRGKGEAHRAVLYANRQVVQPTVWTAKGGSGSG